MSVLMCQGEMYTGRVTSSFHGEFADEADGQTDGRQTVTLRFPLNTASVTISLGLRYHLRL